MNDDSDATEPMRDEWDDKNDDGARAEKESDSAEDAASPSEGARAPASSQPDDFLPESGERDGGDDGSEDDDGDAAPADSEVTADAPESLRHEELAGLVGAREEVRTGPGRPRETATGGRRKSAAKTDGGPAASEEKSAEQAAAEQTGNYAHSDGGGVSSQRMRLIPPDHKKVQWWVRYKRQLIALEWGLTGLFFLLALYFLYLWIFGKPAYACRPDPSWKVAAEPGRWRNIVVHHTATERGSPVSIDRYHREVRKWEGLGYHFLIGNGLWNGRDPTLGDGEVHVGVRWLEQRDGAHVRMKNVKRANSFAIGIALIGNFENEPPTPRQVAALRCLLRFLCGEYHISPDKISGHGEVSENHTLCPGKYLPLKGIVAGL